MGARGSLTSLTFRLEVVSAATGDTVPTAVSGDCSGGAGEVLAGSGDPPIKSLTSLFTSSLSLESGSGDFVRPGVDPRITSWDYGETLDVRYLKHIWRVSYIRISCFFLLLLAGLSQLL